MRHARLPTTVGAMLALTLAGCAQDRTDDTVAGPEANPAATAQPAATDTQAATDLATPTPAGTAAAQNLTVAEKDETGPYLTDDAGSALYRLQDDRDGSGCTDVCLEVWPPLLVTDALPTAEGDADSNLLATVERADGTVQVTYDEQPLYRYAADTGAGRTAGHGVSDQWGQWHLLTPEGDAVD